MKQLILSVDATSPDEWHEPQGHKGWLMQSDLCCKSEENSVQLHLRVHVEDRDGVLAPHNSQDSVDAGRWAALSGAAHQLSRRSDINVYTPMIIDACSISGVLRQDAIAIEARDDLYAALEQATNRQRSAEISFSRSKQLLLGGSDVFSYRAGEAIAAASFISQCMGLDSAFFMGAWILEKRGRVTHATGELVGRKNVHHANYIRAMERLRDVLYSANCPKVWKGWPPVLNA